LFGKFLIAHDLLAALWVRIMPLGGGTTPKWLGLGQSAV
jgi:hypothetical protein